MYYVNYIVNRQAYEVSNQFVIDYRSSKLLSFVCKSDIFSGNSPDGTEPLSSRYDRDKILSFFFILHENTFLSVIFCSINVPTLLQSKRRFKMYLQTQIYFIVFHDL